MRSFRSRLAAAFRSLRKQGLLARSNFSCCSSCAGYELTNMAIAKVKAGQPKEEIKGCVYWHRQANQSLDVRGQINLCYGPLESAEFGTIGLPDVEVGELVVAALKAEGVRVEWDGDGNTRILAIDPDRPEVADVKF